MKNIYQRLRIRWRIFFLYENNNAAQYFYLNFLQISKINFFPQNTKFPQASPNGLCVIHFIIRLNRTVRKTFDQLAPTSLHSIFMISKKKQKNKNLPEINSSLPAVSNFFVFIKIYFYISLVERSTCVCEQKFSKLSRARRARELCRLFDVPRAESGRRLRRASLAHTRDEAKTSPHSREE